MKPLDRLSHKDQSELIRLIRLMGWDRQHFTSSGIETYDKIVSLLNQATSKTV